MLVCFREYKQGLEWYRQQMPLSLPSQITLEKTPNYLVDWEVPKRVYNFNESIKLILIVREPISRAVSDYVQLRVRIAFFSSLVKFTCFFYFLSNMLSSDLTRFTCKCIESLCNIYGNLAKQLLKQCLFLPVEPSYSFLLFNRYLIRMCWD